MPMGRFLVFIGRLTFRMTIIIRKNFILHLEIPGFVSFKPDLAQLELESAGTSGFRKLQEAWHF